MFKMYVYFWSTRLNSIYLLVLQHRPLGVWLIFSIGRRILMEIRTLFVATNRLTSADCIQHPNQTNTYTAYIYQRLVASKVKSVCCFDKLKNLPYVRISLSLLLSFLHTHPKPSHGVRTYTHTHIYNGIEWVYWIVSFCYVFSLLFSHIDESSKNVKKWGIFLVIIRCGIKESFRTTTN